MCRKVIILCFFIVRILSCDLIPEYKDDKKKIMNGEKGAFFFSFQFCMIQSLVILLVFDMNNSDKKINAVRFFT